MDAEWENPPYAQWHGGDVGGPFNVSVLKRTYLEVQLVGERFELLLHPARLPRSPAAPVVELDSERVWGALLELAQGDYVMEIDAAGLWSVRLFSLRTS